MFKSIINTKTILADILIKRGNRKDVTGLREGELGYIKDEKRVVVGTIDSIEDVAMKRELTALMDEQEENLIAFKNSYEKELREKEAAKKVDNSKVLERITNKDVNTLKKLGDSNAVAFITREEYEKLMKLIDKGGEE